MFDVVLGIAVLIAIIWWFGRDTSPSGPPPPKSLPASPQSSSSGPAPRVGPAVRPPEAARGDDAFVDGLIIAAYYYGHWGRDADEGPSDPLPGLGHDGLGGGGESEDGEDNLAHCVSYGLLGWGYDPSAYDYGAAGEATEEDGLDDFGDDELGGGFDDPFGFDDDFDF